MNWQSIFIQKPESFNWSKYYFGLTAVLFFAVGIALVFIQPGYLTTDGSIFSAVALKDLKNGTLYVDAWENKPPGIFILIKLFLACLPDPVLALFLLVLVSLVLTVFCVYSIVFKCTESLSLSFILSLLAVFFTFNQNNVNDGLYTEIYGSLCLLLGLYFTMYLNARNRNFMIPLSGFFAGLSFWFKEPFVLILIPLFLYQLTNTLNQKEKIKLIVFTGLPSVLILLILIVNGSFNGFLEMLKYNFSYIDSEESISYKVKLNAYYKDLIQPLSGILVLILYILYQNLKSEKTRVQSLLMLIMYLATTGFFFVSPYNFGHYYYPSFVFLFPAIAMQYKFFKSQNNTVLKWPFIFMCLYSAYQIDEKNEIHRTYEIHSYTPDKIANRLKSEKNKTLFVDYVNAGEYYIKSGLLYPTYLPIALPVHFNETKRGLENRKQIWQDLKNHPPDYLITTYTTSYFSWFLPESDFYEKNYQKVDSLYNSNHEIIYLWQHKINNQ